MLKDKKLNGDDDVKKENTANGTRNDQDLDKFQC